MSEEKKSEWKRLDGDGVKMVYRGEKEKVLVRMWFEGNEREYVFEGMLRFVGFKGEEE